MSKTKSKLSAPQPAKVRSSPDLVPPAMPVDLVGDLATFCDQQLTDWIRANAPPFIWDLHYGLFALELFSGQAKEHNGRVTPFDNSYIHHRYASVVAALSKIGATFEPAHASV